MKIIYTKRKRKEPVYNSREIAEINECNKTTIYYKKAIDNNLTEYQKYLLSPHWKQLKNKKLKEANNRCQLCYSKNYLNVHHRTYVRLGKEKLSDLMVLCRECYSKFHDVFK